MRLRNVIVVMFAVALALGAAAPVAAQSATSGRIVGTLADPQGGVVPGATVTASSPQLQGSRESVTDANGEFRFLSLPPGTYSVKAELSGFSPVQRDNVMLNVNATVTLPLTLSLAGVEANVEVTATAPVIDTTSPLGGVTVTAEVFNNLPMKRDFYAVARLAPGVVRDAVGAGGDLYDRTLVTVGPSMYGGTGAENQYIIDGLNVTGMNYGEQTKTVNMDFVQEVQVLNTGLNAEYGRMNGGIINVVTQSGGNAFHGNAFGFYEGGQDNNTASQRPQSTTTVLDVKPVRDGGGAVGGYLLKDRLWFYGAYDRTASRDMRTVIRNLTAGGGDSPNIGAKIPADVNTNLYAAKLTWRLSNNHTLWGSTNGEPSKREGAVFPINGPSSTWSGTLERGAPNLSLHYDGVFGSQLLIRGIIGRDQEKQTYGGSGSTTAQLLNQTVTPQLTSGGFTTFTNQDFKRTIYKGDVTKFLGAHEIKAGADYEKVLTEIERFDGGGGQRIYQLRRTLTGGATQIYFRHRFFVDDQAPGFSRTDPTTWKIAFPLVAAPVDQNTSFYVQDAYKVMSNLSVNVGIRWERQRALGRPVAGGDPYEGFDMKKNWAPRLGVVWDPTKAARGKVFASWGRYYNSVPLDMNIREFGGELECFCNNLTADASTLIPTPEGTASSGLSASGAAAAPVSQLRGGIEAADPAIRGMYSDEWTGGVEWELPMIRHTSVGAKIVRRTLGRAIEDFLQEDGNFRIGNPSEGTFGLSMGSMSGELVPAPKPERNDTAIELTVRKRYSDNWQLLASYVWNKLEGNYDGSFQVSTGQLDPGINSAYDYADFLVNATGPLSGERKNQFKLDGSYTLSQMGVLNGLTLGGSFHLFSGLPLTAYGYSVPYGNWEYYLTPRGALGRSPADYEADLQVMYPVKLGATMRADVQFAVFNVFNRQALTQKYPRWFEIADGPCAQVTTNALKPICNGDGGIAHIAGTITPVAQLADPIGSSPNPDFLKTGIGFTTPRTARIGVRLTF